MRFAIPVLVYRTFVNVSISDKQGKLNRWNNAVLGQFDDYEESFTVRGRSYGIYINEEGFRCADIVIDQRKINHGVIAHEVLHAVCYIMRYVNIPLCEESEEAYTCLNEYLIEVIHRKLGSVLPCGS